MSEGGTMEKVVEAFDGGLPDRSGVDRCCVLAC